MFKWFVRLFALYLLALPPLYGFLFFDWVGFAIGLIINVLLIVGFYLFVIYYVAWFLKTTIEGALTAGEEWTLRQENPPKIP